MVDNSRLGIAKRDKNDEFYTQFRDIEAEIYAYFEFNREVFRDKIILCPCDDPEWSEFTRFFAVNFQHFGLKKLISTSYAPGAANRQLTLFEEQSPIYDPVKHETRGKLFTVTNDENLENINVDDIKLTRYLDGSGDFKSDEVCKLRDEADFIITNPPFAKFREFLKWIMDAGKKFIILGNMNAITYKEVFPLMKNNLIWLGYSIHSGDRKFNIPDDYPIRTERHGIDEKGRKYLFVSGVRWFTNVEHGQRHEKMQLDTMANNLRFDKKLRKHLTEKYNKIEFPKYDNYDAVEIPFTGCIPSDYAGVMGVPISFMDRYNPEQFEILGIDCQMSDNPRPGRRFLLNGRETYARILIKSKHPE